jgi:hypothetical protein
MAGLDHRDTVTDFEMPTGTFFDIGVVHLLTTATIDRLRALPASRVQETGRFSGAGGSLVTGTPRRTVPAGPGELAGPALAVPGRSPEARERTRRLMVAR